MIDDHVKRVTASSYSSAVPIEDIRPEINSEGFRATELKPQPSSDDEEIKSEVYMYKQKT